MPTPYPKCSPTEMMGLLVLLKDHNASDDVARLADDLDLEIDEILPAVDYASLLQLLTVSDGAVTLTDLGKRLLEGTIRDRKSLLREQLRKTTLFKALLRALESAPERRLSEEKVNRLIAFTTAPGDELVQNIINWGRYVELFRFDSDERQLYLPRSRTAARSSAPERPPPPGSTSPPSGRAGSASVGGGSTSVGERTRSLARAPA
ncbi:MAG: AAA-associated domain-containing protein [Thermoplasmata archaeon]|nr:AAA-associated domain-containing protein [Thermoplasmata archaeon]